MKAETKSIVDTVTVLGLLLIVLSMAVGEASGRRQSAFVAVAVLSLLIVALHRVRTLGAVSASASKNRFAVYGPAAILLPGVLFSRNPVLSIGLAAVAATAYGLFYACRATFGRDGTGACSPRGFAGFLVLAVIVLVAGRLAGVAASGRSLSVSLLAPNAGATPALGHLFDFLLVLMLPGLWAGLGSLPPGRERTLGRGAVCLTALAILLSFGRAAWLAAGASIMVLAVRDRSVRRPVAFASVIAIGVCLASPAVRSRAQSVIHLDHTTNHQRLEQWAAAGAMIVQSPLVGHGLGSFGRYYQERFAPESRHYDCPHNLYLHLAAESGLPALFAFAAWVAWAIYRLRFPHGAVATTPDCRWRTAAIAVIAAILVFGCFDL